MTETVTANLWELIWEAIALNPDAFRLMERLPYGSQTALWILLIAGFSEALAQAIVLFANRVKPFRFAISLGIAVLLFVAGFFFWAGSTWLVSTLVFRKHAPLAQLLRVLALSFAPKTLSIFIALPYFGVPISVVLSIWSFLAFLVGINVSLGLSLWQAFACGVLGWAVFQILQNTIGRPVAAIGRWIRNTAAGVSLVTDLKDLERAIAPGRQP